MTSDLDNILATYAEQRQLAEAGLREDLADLLTTRPEHAENIIGMCMLMFDGGIAAAHDRTLRWRYCACEMPDDDLSAIGAIFDRRDGSTYIEGVYHAGDVGWCYTSSGDRVESWLEVFAWAPDPNTPSYRPSVGGDAAA